MPNCLRIITYNIHRCLGVDRRISPERISDVIAVHQPDVLALQEVDFGLVRPTRDDQAARIAERLHFSPVWIERERCGNAVVSRYPMKLIKAGGLHRPRKWHSLARRGALWVEVEAFGARIQIINTHLGLTPAARHNQVRVLVGPEWLGSPECRAPVILCGDFNAQAGSPLFRSFEGRFRNIGESTSGGQIEKTWPSPRPLLGIDHMFISGDLAVEAVRVPAEGAVRIASDHLPLFVQLSLQDSALRDI